MTTPTSLPHGTLPGSADQASVKPFVLQISESKIDDMKTLLRLSPVASSCYENSLPDGSRRLGLRREWLLLAKETWEHNFDWRKHEQRINSFPNFWAKIPFEGSTIGIHFTALFSQKPDATPLVFFHGWPGSILEFLPILTILRERYPDPEQMPYHVIVPSLPGYALSDAPPLDRDFHIQDASQIFDHLLVKVLGLTGYVTQGGDVGSRIARTLAAEFEHCRGVHLNFCPVPQPSGTSVDDLPELEKKGLERAEWFQTDGRAYARMQATRPGTLGLVLSASPLALLSWVAEKFLDWSDPTSFPADNKLPESNTPYSQELMEEILVSTTLYWLSGHAHTCWFSYRELTYSKESRDHHSQVLHIHAPKQLGYSYFPLEISPTPKSWVEKTGNLVFSRAHERGGHFAALERPEVLLDDFEEFVTKNILA